MPTPEVCWNLSPCNRADDSLYQTSRTCNSVGISPRGFTSQRERDALWPSCIMLDGFKDSLEALPARCEAPWSAHQLSLHGCQPEVHNYHRSFHVSRASFFLADVTGARQRMILQRSATAMNRESVCVVNCGQANPQSISEKSARMNSPVLPDVSLVGVC